MSKLPFDIGDNDLPQITEFAKTLLRIQADTMMHFGVTEDELADIMSGRRKVARVLYVDSRRQNRAGMFIKRIGIAATLIILACCFTIPGFADSVRTSVINLFVGQRAVRVEAVQYNAGANLSGFWLPSRLPLGYAYQTHMQSPDSGMLYVVYADAMGRTVSYYYYPHAVSASYDNENTQAYALNYTGGTMTVMRESGGATAIYLHYRDGAFIQMDFEVEVTDEDLCAIVESLKRQ